MQSRLVNKLFVGLIGKTMGVYVDDILIKIVKTENQAIHLGEAFQILCRYMLRLNLLKCALEVASRKFLGYMVNQRDIEANLEIIKALIEMRLL